MTAQQVGARHIAAGFTVKDAVMIAGYVVAGVIAFMALKGNVETLAEHVDGKVQLLQLAQDTTQHAIANHVSRQPHDPDPATTQKRIEDTQDQVHIIHTRQAVIEQIVKDTQDDVSKNRAILENINRGINELKRQ